MQASTNSIEKERIIPAKKYKARFVSTFFNDVKLEYVAFAAILFGVKLWLIGAFGNATPYWDQWDAEAELLYKPFLDGTLKFSDLFAPHNEHRIFTTRILALFILGINKIWSPMLQMVVNAGLHVGLLVFTIALMVRIVGRNYLAALLGFSLILFAIPYAWENTLAAFQSQFYFVLFFSISCLWLTVTKDPLSRMWWLGVLCAVLAFFSLASGVFALAASVCMHVLFYLFKVHRSNKQLVAASILAALFVFGTWLTPTLEGHAFLKATSFNQFYTALVAVLSWPIGSNILTAALRNLPGLIFVVLMLWRPPQIKDKRWFLLALVVWSIGQCLSIAYGRAGASVASRYTDLFAITILVNFACLIEVAKTYVFKKQNYSLVFAAFWILIVFVSLSWYSTKTVSGELAIKSSTSKIQEMNTKNYLITGNFEHLNNKPHLEIPYPSSERLASILSSPMIREILPSTIGNKSKLKIVKNASQEFVPNGYYFTTPDIADTVFGSYNTKGDGGIGQAEIEFESRVSNGELMIPVAGYPLNSGMKIEILQDGKSSPVTIQTNPKETWGIAYAKIKDSKFSLLLTDSSATTWLAIGTPSVSSKLDAINNKLLTHYYLPLILGLVLMVYLFLKNGLLNGMTKQSKHE
jgi:hypothetical protein